MTDQFVYFVGWLHITAYGLLAATGFGLACMYAGLWLIQRILVKKAIYGEVLAFIQERIRRDPETYRRFWK